MSGGGEWGTKASLLSLDPQNSHGRESEEDELDKFIKSFNRDDDAKDCMAKPGDFVQFFVERGPPQLAEEHRARLIRSTTSYSPVSFGVGDMNLKDPDLPGTSVESQRRLVPKQDLDWIAIGHFGGHSAEGVYLSAGEVGPNTKVDVPGACVNMNAAHDPSVVNASYHPVKQKPFKRKKRAV